MMKRDVETRADLETVLSDFYTRVFDDDVIAFFFTDVVPLDMQKHLPVITDFWEAVIFGARRYGKNVMEVHRHIHQKAAIEKKHLDRWVQLFTQTVQSHFEGPNATLMQQRAQSVATLMHIKLHHPPINKIQP